MATKRLFIYVNDIVRITGKHQKTCERLFNLLRERLKKAPGQPITIGEYCRAEDLNQEEVEKFLGI